MSLTTVIKRLEVMLYLHTAERGTHIYTMSKCLTVAVEPHPTLMACTQHFHWLYFSKEHTVSKIFDYAYVYTFGKLVWKKKYDAADALKALEQNVYTGSECTLSGSMVYTLNYSS